MTRKTAIVISCIFAILIVIMVFIGVLTLRLSKNINKLYSIGNQILQVPIVHNSIFSSELSFYDLFGSPEDDGYDEEDGDVSLGYALTPEPSLAATPAPAVTAAPTTTPKPSAPTASAAPTTAPIAPTATPESDDSEFAFTPKATYDESGEELDWYTSNPFGDESSNPFGDDYSTDPTGENYPYPYLEYELYPIEGEPWITNYYDGFFLNSKESPMEEDIYINKIGIIMNYDDSMILPEGIFYDENSDTILYVDYDSYSDSYYIEVYNMSFYYDEPSLVISSAYGTIQEDTGMIEIWGTTDDGIFDFYLNLDPSFADYVYTVGITTTPYALDIGYEYDESELYYIRLAETK